MTPHTQYAVDKAATAKDAAVDGAPGGQISVEKTIEVTPQMLEAAHPFLWDEQVMPWEDSDEVLTKIYRAMETARRSAPASDNS